MALRFATNSIARFSSVLSMDWDHVTGKPDFPELYTPLNFTQAGSGAIPYTYPEKVDQVYSVKDFGVTGDGVTDDYAKITIAINTARAEGKTLVFPDGVYCHSGTLKWAYEKFAAHAMGSNVVLKHTGTGIGHDFNGFAIYASQGCVGGVFGGPNRFKLEGNANTTYLVLVDNWHFGHMRIAPKNAALALLEFQDTGIVGASAVETTFDVKISTNYSGAFTTIPLYGIHGTSVAACVFDNPIVEFVGNAGSSTPGLSLLGSRGNVFNGGTVESCLAGGISLDAGCSRNTFIQVHCEVNGTQQDWLISGDSNIFIGCAGAATTTGQFIAGDYNKFIGCKLQSPGIQTGATGNVFENCAFLVDYLDNGTRTSFINPDTSTPSAISVPGADKSTGTLFNKSISGANNTLAVRVANDVTGLGTGVATALAANVGSAGAPVVFNGAGGTPSSITLTNAAGLPVATGVAGLGTGIATFLATPSSANLRAALTDETGTGIAYFVGGALGTPASGVATNLTGTAAGLTAGNVTTNANLTGAITSVGNAASLGSFTSAALAAALTDEDGTGLVPFETTGTWTPTDQSGAGLTFSAVNCRYTKIGNMVHVYGTFTYPTNADATAALIGGLPVTVPNQSYAALPGVLKNNVGVGTGFPLAVINSTTFRIFSNTTAANIANSTMSNAAVVMRLSYPIS